MKACCEYCKKDISKTVFQTMTKNEIGRIQCPHCKRENKRYISELDLLYTFLLNCIVYGLAVIVFIFVTTLNSAVIDQYFFVVYFAMLVVTLGVCYFFTKYNSIYQYIHPPLHKSWYNKKLDEDAEEVNKRMNFNLIMFMVIAIVVGTMPEWFYLFLFMYLAFAGITAYKVYLLYKNELAYQTKKDS